MTDQHALPPSAGIHMVDVDVSSAVSAPISEELSMQSVQRDQDSLLTTTRNRPQWRSPHFRPDYSPSSSVTNRLGQSVFVGGLILACARSAMPTEKYGALDLLDGVITSMYRNAKLR